MRIILPKSFCQIDLNYGPFFFLAGPVHGGDDWQAKCCYEIQKHIPNFYAALPCNYREDHTLLKFRFVGDGKNFDFQLDWERHYLDFAANFGCLIFWLPAESKTNPNKGTYARDTRGELGEWRGRLMYEPKIRIVVGGESNFPGLGIIQRNFNLATKTEFTICSSLTETVLMAIKKAV
jgi:hypothetical protein